MHAPRAEGLAAVREEVAGQEGAADHPLSWDAAPAPVDEGELAGAVGQEGPEDHVGPPRK